MKTGLVVVLAMLSGSVQASEPGRGEAARQQTRQCEEAALIAANAYIGHGNDDVAANQQIAEERERLSAQNPALRPNDGQMMAAVGSVTFHRIELGHARSLPSQVPDEARMRLVAHAAATCALLEPEAGAFVAGSLEGRRR